MFSPKKKDEMSRKCLQLQLKVWSVLTDSWLGLGLVRFGWVWLGWVRLGLVCLGLVRLGLVRFGLTGFGYFRFGEWLLLYCVEKCF